MRFVLPVVLDRVDLTGAAGARDLIASRGLKSIGRDELEVTRVTINCQW